MTVTPERQMHLESVRGLAALVVVFNHLVLAFYPQMRNWMNRPEVSAAVPGPLRPLAAPPLNVTHNGAFAVAVFFVLSGFVLSYSFFRADGVEKRSASLASAAVRRYFRLVLPILASVLVAYTLLRLGALHHRQLADFLHGQPGWVPSEDDWWIGGQWNVEPRFLSALREALYGVFFSFDPQRTYSAVLWTMGIELAGSFFVYSFLALFGSLRNRWVIYLIAGGLLAALGSLHMLAFLAGMAVSDAYAASERRQSGAARSRRWELLRAYGGLALCAAGLCAGAMWWDGTFSVHVPARPAMLLGATMLITGSAVSPLVRKMLNRRPFVFLGKVSFSMYLLHLLVLFSVAAWLYLRMRQSGWSHGSAAAAASVTCVVATLAVSWVAHRLVDRPAIALGRYVYARVFAPAKPADPALVRAVAGLLRAAPAPRIPRPQTGPTSRPRQA
jgi:peptidoglycan/LPS O-acetylase OafA/YrhL